MSTTNITKSQLKQLIKEELKYVLSEQSLGRLPGVDTMPPGEEFTGPTPEMVESTVEERLAELERQVEELTKLVDDRSREPRGDVGRGEPWVA